MVLAPLAIVLIGALAYAITASNYYYSQGHQDSGFWHQWWSWMSHGGIAGDIGRALKTLFTKAVSHWMGEAATAVDAHVATTIHYVANTVRQAGDTIVAVGAFAITAAQAVTGQVSWSQVNAQLRQFRARLRAFEHTAQVALAHSLAEVRAIRHSVAHGVYPRLGALEHDVTRVIPREIKAARHLAREAEDEALKAFKVAKHALARTSTGAIAAVVATAIAALGLDWLSCRDGASRAGRSGCGLWDDLGSVFGLLMAAEIALNFETFVHDAQEITEATATAVKDVVGLG